MNVTARTKQSRQYAIYLDCFVVTPRKSRFDDAKRVNDVMCFKMNYSFGPAATRALPAAFVVNFSKFLMKREERSLAFSSQAFLSA